MSNHGHRVMFSAAAESFGAAVRELRGAFGPTLAVERAGPDLGVIDAPAPTVSEVAAACADRPLVFIRHLTTERELIRLPEAVNLTAVADAVTRAVTDDPAGPELAVQTWESAWESAWESGPARLGYGPADLYRHLAETLRGHGITVSRAGQPQTLSGCLTETGVRIGLAPTNESLSDWPGGRVRLARRPAQVSRSELKLEELLQIVPLQLPVGGRAVDLGASPGGWTRILRGHDLAVWAVDPGELDPRVATDPEVHHARTTAGEFFRGNRQPFDLAVNDMRMDPMRSCQLMRDAADQLKPGALAVVTLKTGTHRPVETVHRCLELLGTTYQVEYARQLHHNRREVTVVARRRH